MVAISYKILPWMFFCSILVTSICFQSVWGNELLISENNFSKYCPNHTCNISRLNITEKKEFYGLASYYNNVHSYLIDKKEVNAFKSDSKFTLGHDQWFVIVGRLNVLLVKGNGLMLEYKDNDLILYNHLPSQQTETFLKVVAKSDLPLIATELDPIRYIHLWNFLAWMAKQVEFTLVILHNTVVSNWGLVIVIFSILLKLLLLPVSLVTINFQRRVSQVQTKLAPELANIKNNYAGEEAHNKLMAAYKTAGVSPFYTLKPMLGSLIQVPILIAVFNALGEMPQLYGQSFLWIENLSYTDNIIYLPFSIPMFGNTINILPFIMTAITVFSTSIFQNPYAPKAEVRLQKINLYLMAITFFILFYPFPSAMVLYWTLANILQTIQQQTIKV